MMETKKPITRPEWPVRTLRVIWHISTVLVVGLVFAALPAAADAGQRRARLSSDLTQHLNSSATDNVEVIVSGSVERVERIASRHGLRVKKQLSSGAVFSVSKQTLEAMSHDEEIESLSGNARVKSQMAITTADLQAPREVCRFFWISFVFSHGQPARDQVPIR